ncbi:type II secretion system GspH family protein [Patescibacteria group bacterium]|nr:type II secretion system GspH family protein [Patescibacteria group bacterium]
MRKGFTLIEIIVVIAVFGVLMLAGTSFLISVIRNANQVRIQNDVRQTASQIMEDIASEMRSATDVTFSSGLTQNVLTITNTTIVPSRTVVYTAYNTGKLTKTVNSGAPLDFTSDNNDTTSQSEAVVLDTSAVSCDDSLHAAKGLQVVVGTNLATDITLTLQQATKYVTPDFCARIQLKNTLVPRRY